MQKLEMLLQKNFLSPELLMIMIKILETFAERHFDLNDDETEEKKGTPKSAKRTEVPKK